MKRDLLLFVLLFCVCEADVSFKRVIYGVDDRVEANPRWQNLTQAIFGMMYRGRERGPWKEFTSACGGVPLCEGERFVGEPTGPWCTGFFVSPTLAVTAGHCARRTELVAFVFDFPNVSEVVYPIRLLKRVNTYNEDYALYEANLPGGREPLNVSVNMPMIGDALLMIGHPMGLPLKADEGGKLNGMSATLLSATLDSYAGNSGSPVFLGEEVVGVVVSGNADYGLSSTGCCVSNVCSDIDGCQGRYELAMRMDVVYS